MGNVATVVNYEGLGSVDAGALPHAGSSAVRARMC